MRSPSLDSIYINLNKHILLVQSYTEIEGLSFVLRACRFKPYNYIFEDKNLKLILYDHWFDEYGNSIKIKNKKLNIIYNDLSLDRNKIICSDIYYRLPMNKIAKISKAAYICIGTDEDLLQPYNIITFLGIDNYFRTYMYLYGEWEQVSSILIGIKTLKKIDNIKNYLELNIKKDIPKPCFSASAWITSLPASEDFLQLMNKRSNIVYSIF